MKIIPQVKGQVKSKVKSIKDFVKYYADLGLPITPLSSGSKYPKGKWKRKHALEEFEEHDNVGLICGLEPNTFMAFDFDSQETGIFIDLVDHELRAHGITGIIQQSGGEHNGYHYIVKVDKPIKNTKIVYKGQNVDIKGNGYILIEPSRVVREYTILEGSFESLETVKSEAVVEVIRRFQEFTVEEVAVQEVKEVAVEEFKEVKEDRTGELIIDDLSLYNTFAGWKRLSEKYGVKMPFELNKPFKSLEVLHGKEDHKPSAEFYRASNGSIVYRDFGSDRAYTLPEVWHALHTKQAPRIKQDRQAVLSKWAGEMIDDLNIYTRGALEYQQKLNAFIEAVREELPDRFTKVWQVIANRMRRAYDHGGDIYTARWLSKEAGVGDHMIANKALNLLAACGVVRKGEDKTLKAGVSQKIEPVKDFDLQMAKATLRLIKDNLQARHLNWNQFSRKAVSEVLSPQIVDQVFTRERDQKT